LKSLVEEVEKGYARGWSFTPLIGKIPMLKAWQKAPRPAIEQCRTWARDGNVALRTGMASGVAVIDIDKNAECGAAYRMSNFPPTLTVRTGGDGYHLYYKCHKPIKNSVSQLAPHVDVRGDCGLAVFAGSLHPDTEKAYQWHNALPLAEFPYHLVKVEPPPPRGPPRSVPTGSLDAYVRGALQKAYDTVSQAQEGQRQHTLHLVAFDIGGAVGAGWIPHHMAATTLRSAGLYCHLPLHEVEKTITRSLSDGAAKPKDIDIAIAQKHQQRPPEFAGF
jgi:hypothetical protein